jgi:2-succinyl-5-enolpyruvyl-6-hydroxy-3-cyclohexene-1-carboxylate synthase
MASERERPGFEALPAAVGAFAAAFFEELARSGVQHVVVSPGSRSTPLVVAARRTPELRCWPVVDERSAGFFALGLARQSAAPVALLCTSGTAAANYLPAVIEAHYGRVPLLILTADRPPELREWGAGQTIDQVGIYGNCVRGFVELPLPEAGAAPLRYVRRLACRAVSDARGGVAGPVHLNWPLREPLDPGEAAAGSHAGRGERAESRDVESARLEVAVGEAALPPAEIEALVELVAAYERGWIVCGPLAPDADRSRMLAEFARQSGWPLIADPISQMRCGPHVEGAPILAHTDLCLRDPELARDWAPDVVLRIGDSPVSKALRLALEARPPEQLILVDPDGVWHDPSHLATRRLVADPARLCGAWLEAWRARGGAARESSYTRALVAADRRADEALARAQVLDAALLEPRAVAELAAALPAAATLYVSNSMPIRDLDAFLPLDSRPLALLGHRGASGIDGLVSAAAGAAAADRGPVVLLLGDLALLHDIGGLLTAASLECPLSILVLNNDGGGIFSFLPVAERGESVDFERLFRTPHGLDFSHAAALAGARFVRVRDAAALSSALADAIGAPGLDLIEVPVDRDANVKRFRELSALAIAAAREA